MMGPADQDDLALESLAARLAGFSLAEALEVRLDVFQEVVEPARGSRLRGRGWFDRLRLGLVLRQSVFECAEGVVIDRPEESPLQRALRKS